MADAAAPAYVDDGGDAPHALRLNDALRAELAGNAHAFPVEGGVVMLMGIAFLTTDVATWYTDAAAGGRRLLAVATMDGGPVGALAAFKDRVERSATLRVVRSGCGALRACIREYAAGCGCDPGVKMNVCADEGEN